MKAHTEAARKFLTNIVSAQISAEAFKDFEKMAEQVSSFDSERYFHISFSKIPRLTGKAIVQLKEQDYKEASFIRNGFTIQDWTIDRVARVLLILSLPYENSITGETLLTQLFSAADVSELVALYSSLALLPHPEDFTDRAAEGIRNNMTVVYDAVALNNPFPAEYLSEGAWNQLILKGIFNGRPLSKVYNIDKRSNATLAGMLSSFAHERWAAGRDVTPELWRCVGPFINDALLADIKKILNSTNTLEQQAGALACSASNHPGAQQLLNSRPDLKAQIQHHSISWQTIADGLATHS